MEGESEAVVRDTPAPPPPLVVVLRYTYPGVTLKNGRVVTAELPGGGGELQGSQVTALLVGDGVDLGRAAVQN